MRPGAEIQAAATDAKAADTLKVDVRRRSSWRRVMWWDAAYDGPLLEALWNDPDGVVARGTMLKRGRGTTVVRIDGAEPVVVKRYNLRNRGRTLSHLLLPSRASRSWEGALRLREAGIATPRPLAALETRLGPLRLRSFFVYPYLSGEMLDRTLRRPSVSSEETQAVWEEVSSVAQKLKAARLTHGDGKPANLLWQQGRLWLLDVDAVEEHRSEWSWKRARDREVRRLLQDFQAEPHLRGPLSQAAQGG